jgi:hypothetical protein
MASTGWSTFGLAASFHVSCRFPRGRNTYINKHRDEKANQRYILTIKRDCFRISSKHLQEAWLSNRIEIKMYFVIAFNVLVKVE